MTGSPERQAKAAFSSWLFGLKKYSGSPARGTIAGSLVVLERLKVDFLLDINSHTAKGGSQVRGASGSTVTGILARFGENRPFVSEGGRTNRGLRGDIQSLLKALQEANVGALSKSTRTKVLEEMQRLLVGQVKEFHNRQRIDFVFDASASGWKIVHDVMEAAVSQSKESAVAEYLVGAKLALRFPQQTIRNKTFSAADIQVGESGDFQIEDTVFHVTISPTGSLFEKCKQNLRDGLRVYVLVPERITAGTRQIAEQTAAGRIQVVSLEDFISQNVEEISEFSSSKLREGFRQLFENYNERVDAVENDKSLLLEVPANLRQRRR